MAKQNDGAPGVDGVTFEAIEAQGEEGLLEQLRDELTGHTYTPLPARRQEIPKDGGKVRVLSIPAIRDRVVQGALKLILEPVFEVDFQPGSFGYRPKWTAHDAIKRVAEAIVQRKTRVALDRHRRPHRPWLEFYWYADPPMFHAAAATNCSRVSSRPIAGSVR